jgi:fructose 1,6-bisphosphatase
LLPATSVEYNNIEKPIIKYSLKKVKSEEASNLPSMEEAMKNPYPNGTSEIVITKGLISGVNFKLYFIDSKKSIKVNSKDISDWSKVLALTKNAKADEIVYKAGKLAEYQYDKKFDVLGSIAGMSKTEFHDLYLVIKNTWSKFPKIWQKIEESIKIIYKG